MTTPNSMIEGRRADSARRRERVLKALQQAAKNGAEMSVSAIARAAGVDRTFVYRHRDLLTRIHAAASEPPGTDGTGPLVSRASKPTWPAPTTGPDGRPTGSDNWSTSSPSCSASRSGTNPESASQQTSSNCTAASQRWSSR
ncbi:DUF6262 family protein [Kitasatospora aureofaciens]|uniref:DUF6262 family protein n=1 Tax=Kitasatospora aureofaciens TaxID=1894 RepID=UPI0033A51C9D